MLEQPHTLPARRIPLVPIHKDPPSPAAWLASVRAKLELPLRRLLTPTEKDRIDPVWSDALEQLERFVLRPGKRVRPALLLSGFAIATGADAHPPDVWR